MRGLLQARLPHTPNSQLLCCRHQRDANACRKRHPVVILALAKPRPRISRDRECTASTSCQPQELFIRHASQRADASELRRSSPAAAASAAVAMVVALLLQPSAAGAEGIPTELIQGFLEEVQAVGPLGPGLFVIAVVTAELIPLFPTQPLALTAGLLFGTFKGAAFMLTGTSLAALIAFSIARRTGGGLDLFQKEGGGDDAAWRKALARVQTAIESGDLSQQLLAMTILRLTPVTPFSASNYILGLTPIALPAFMGGTVIGMGVWSVVYSSIGGAGRSLLQSGVRLDELLADMGHKASEYTEEAAVVAAVAAVGALGVWFVRRREQEHSE